MSFIKKMLSLGSNPIGIQGVIIGKLMNLFHLKKYLLGLDGIKIGKDWICLDIGCAGGNLTRSLSERVSEGKVYGLDHSADMIRLAHKVNRDKILEGKMIFLQGSVSALPFDENSFDLITAAETVQFWPDPENDFKEVKRVLKAGGIFLIMNRLPPEDNEKWMQHLQIKNENHYRELLNRAGFSQVEINSGLEKRWILIKAQR